MPLALHVESYDVRRRLAELDLEEEPLRAAVGKGHLRWASCTDNHPRIYAPLVAWAETVAALREYLRTMQWASSDENNYSLAISPDGSLAIAVATGNEGTGRVDLSPSTTAAKGKNTVAAVMVNQNQLQLFDPLPSTISATRASTQERTTWLLLIRREEGEIRCELSLPVSVDSDMRVHQWRERILLRAIPRDPQGLDEGNPPQLPDLDIAVRRRA